MRKRPLDTVVVRTDWLPQRFQIQTKPYIYAVKNPPYSYIDRVINNWGHTITIKMDLGMKV